MGTKVRGVGVSLSAYVGGSTGFDGLLVITPQGRVQFQSGIGNLGTESVIDVHRAGAERLGVPWEICDVVWGDTSKHRSLHMRFRRQHDDAHDEPRVVCGGRRVQAAAEGDCGEDAWAASQTITKWPTSASSARAAARG